MERRAGGRAREEAEAAPPKAQTRAVAMIGEVDRSGLALVLGGVLAALCPT